MYLMGSVIGISIFVVLVCLFDSLSRTVGAVGSIAVFSMDGSATLGISTSSSPSELVIYHC